MVGVCGCDTCMVVMQLIISSFPHAFYNTCLQMYGCLTVIFLIIDDASHIHYVPQNFRYIYSYT